jgi:hypothetical protein
MGNPFSVKRHAQGKGFAAFVHAGRRKRWGGEEVLDAAHWVGAIKRGAEGSYMQLQDRVCRWNKAAL